jgi:archaetidylinositol phosphate synthase
MTNRDQHGIVNNPAGGFRQAQRIHTSMLAPVESRVMVWLAQRAPHWVRSDHMTALGLASLAAAGLSYWYARWSQTGLHLATLFLVLNYLGDSLDGTLARVRHCERPRFGAYIDHLVDAAGVLLVLIGLACSGYMGERAAAGLVIAYFLVSIEVHLAAYTVGRFHVSIGLFGPTELRLILIAGNFLLPWSSVIRWGGRDWLLFDVGGAVIILYMLCGVAQSAVRHAALLYRAENGTRT